MITGNLKNWIKKYVKKQKGQDHPCSNQIVKKVILLRDSSRIAAFEQAYPHFVCYRRNIYNENRYIDPKTEELWITKPLSENLRGYRFYKVIIDSTIDNVDLLHNIVFGCMSHYCCDVEFFE